MKLRIGIGLASALLFFGSGFIQAQNKPADIFHDSEGNTYHQLFLDFQATELIEIRYANDQQLLDGELTGDGYSIVIKNYPGDRSVKVKVIDKNGLEKEVTKSRCFIDPVILNL